MANLVILKDRPLVRKYPSIHGQVDYAKLKQFVFDTDYDAIDLLKNISPITLETEHPLLLYPGCGADIFYPLLYCDRLFSIKACTFLFVDIQDNAKLIMAQLSDVGIGFYIEQDTITFYWNKRLVKLRHIVSDINQCLESLEYDIYFERAFRAMREGIPRYEERVLERLRPKGVLISDSGFSNVGLEQIKIPLELSSYHEMILGRKIGKKRAKK